MAKEAYYFSHDFGARNDPKLQKVLMKHGQAGKGVYWDLVEMLFEEGGRLLVSDIESYSFALRTTDEIINSLIKDFGLFRKDTNYFWSDSVGRRIEERNSKSQKARESAQERWNKANALKLDANALLLECDGNAIKEKKGEEKKGDTIIVELALPTSTSVDSVMVRCQKFVDFFNKQKQSKYQATDEVVKSFKRAIKKYKPDELMRVISAALNDPRHRETNFQYITPEFVLRTKIIERYLNMTAFKPSTVATR